MGTLHLSHTCRCDDGLDYFVKDGKAVPTLPHAEWFCTRLAETLGLAGPPCAVLEMLDGTLAFGSRCEGGVLQPNEHWWEKVARNEIPLADIRVPLSRIYAFDHFVHNDDRHLTNYLVRAQSQGHALLAFDYSKAWVVNQFPLPPLPFDINNGRERTVNAQRWLTGFFGPYLDLNEAELFLEKIKTIPVAQVQRIIDEHPVSWLPLKVKAEILDWWGNGGMAARVDDIITGIKNGNYL